jgi:high-affinity iron transporter
MRWQDLGLTAGGDQDAVSRQLASLSADVAAKVPVDSVVKQAGALRALITRATGIAEQIAPPQPPSPQRGAVIFKESCASCHGSRGDGKGPDSARLDPKPANFTDPAFMRGETPNDFFHVITLGKRGSAMPSWGDVLSLQERWDVLSYVWGRAHDDAQLAEGQGIYLSQCASCHGSAGDGKGAYAANLLTKVPAFTAPAVLGRQTDTELFDAVRDGVAGTAMPAFRHLSDGQRWKVVAFVRTLSLGGPRGGSGTEAGGGGGTRRFGRLLRLLGSEYGSAVAGGKVASDQDLTESDVLASQISAGAATVAEALRTNDPAAAQAFSSQTTRLSRLIAQRAPATEVAKLIDTIAAGLPADAAAPVAAADAGPAAPDPLAGARRLLAEAASAYRNHDPQALAHVSDAYFQFEPLEKKLSVNAPDLTGQVESRFLELRGLLAQPGNEAQVATTVAAIGAELDKVNAALQPQESPYALFVQSATIILREGFEMVLVITALLAYVKKSGSPRMARAIHAGAGAGVAMSLVTAWVFAQLFHETSVGAAEILGGFTMLLAALVLFWVSYWLVSKAEADKWQRYIQGKVKTALSTGSMFALGGAAFLAVFREGVETVLFYQAVFGAAPDATGTAVSGLLTGLVALAAVYVLLTRFGMRLPIRPFFLGTSVLLYYMAVVFAGNGIAELQESGLVGVTPVAGVPRIGFLGLYPTAETLFAQGILVALLLYAVVVLWRRRAAGETVATPAGGTALLDELRDLRQLAVEIRSELRRHLSPAAAVPEQTSRRLDTLIERVEILEGQMQLNLPANGGAKAASH